MHVKGSHSQCISPRWGQRAAHEWQGLVAAARSTHCSSRQLLCLPSRPAWVLQECLTTKEPPTPRGLAWVLQGYLAHGKGVVLMKGPTGVRLLMSEVTLHLTLENRFSQSL